MPKQKMTIEDLAVMVKRGFDATATHEDLRTLERKVDGLEQRFDGLEQKVDGLEQKMTQGFQHINARLDTLRHDISDLPALREAVQNLQQRVDRLEKKVAISR